MNTNIENIDWQTHAHISGAERGVVKFDNGYEASCLRGGSQFLYTNGGTYEIAVQYNGDIVYDTPITSDVLGYLTTDEANQALESISNLPPRKGE